MGGQLDAQIGGLPCPTPSCKPAGGKREVKARLEEPGGGWRMEVLYNPFDFMQNYLIFNQFGSRVEWGEDFWMKVKVSFEFVKFSMTCELWIGGPAHEPVFSRVGEDEMNQMKVKVLSHI